MLLMFQSRLPYHTTKCQSIFCVFRRNIYLLVPSLLLSFCITNIIQYNYISKYLKDFYNKKDNFYCF